MEPRLLGSPPAALACDDAVLCASSTHQDGLKDAALPDGSRQLFEADPIEAFARLGALRLDALDGKL